jgi:hypothetical protein
MRRIAAAAALLLALPALGRDVSGVTVPETTTVGDHTLQLNGAGVRRKFIFSVYVGALYTENRASAAEEILSAGAAWKMTLHFLRDVDHDRIIGAVRDAFERQSAGLFEQLRPGLEKFDAEAMAGLTVRKGQELTIAYLPGQGATLTVPSGASSRVEGKTFADALLLSWLGQRAADGRLRDALLGLDAPAFYAARQRP